MSNVIIPYTKLPIPAGKNSPEKIIYCPLLETKLYNEQHETHFTFASVVDSGADFCVFPAKYGSIIGLDIKKGQNVVTTGVGGQEVLYFHKIKIEVYIKNEIWKATVEAGFSYKMNKKAWDCSEGKGFLTSLAR